MRFLHFRKNFGIYFRQFGTKQTVSEEKHVFPSRALNKEIERRIRTLQMDMMILNDVDSLKEQSKFESESESNSSIASRFYLASNPSKFTNELASIKSPDIVTKYRSTIDPTKAERVRKQPENIQLPLGRFTEVQFQEKDKTVETTDQKSPIDAVSICDRGFHVEGDEYKDEYTIGSISDLPTEEILKNDELETSDSSETASFTRSDRQAMIRKPPYRLRFGPLDAVEEIDFTLPTQEIKERPRFYRKWLGERPPPRNETSTTPQTDKWYEKNKKKLLDDQGFGEETESEEWKQYYGTVDRSVKPADEKHQCGGCGATFHCHDSSLPGFLPSSLFLEMTDKDDFSGTLCRRCYLIQQHQFLVNVSVSPVDYERVLGRLRTVSEALILLLVDMTDFPACIYPKLPEFIGHGKPLIVVGNKVDLLPPDAESGYVRHFQRCLRRTVIDMGFAERMNLLHVELISAKTGYGIENLISFIFNKWGNKGDIYLIGCTNTGKSTLFNTLLQSDLCKVRAADLLDRATTSVWPGTTLNLLKFPVMNPNPYRVVERTQRLRRFKHVADVEEQHRRMLLEETGDSKYMMLQGLVGRTDEFDMEPKETDDRQDEDENAKTVNRRRRRNMSEENFAVGRWCYDTPGTVHHEQIINYLTLDELIKTVPRTMLRPRTFVLGRQETMFIGGLVRIDYLSGPRGTMLTVFASENLPIYVEDTEYADKLYKKYVGTAAMAVPYGDKQRLASFPALKMKKVELLGIGSKESCADVTFSSAGWIAVTAREEQVQLGVWTPGGTGIFVRQPALLPFLVNDRGNRVAGTNRYEGEPIRFLSEES